MRNAWKTHEKAIVWVPKVFHIHWIFTSFALLKFHIFYSRVYTNFSCFLSTFSHVTTSEINNFWTYQCWGNTKLWRWCCNRCSFLWIGWFCQRGRYPGVVGSRGNQPTISDTSTSSLVEMYFQTGCALVTQAGSSLKLAKRVLVSDLAAAKVSLKQMGIVFSSSLEGRNQVI